MSVYIELVIFNNFAIDLFIVLSTLVIRRKNVGKLRVVLCSTLGAGVATAFAIAPKWGQILIKALLAPAMTLLFDKFDGETVKDKFKDYLKSLGCFCLVTYFIGGITYGLSYVLGIDVKSYPILGIVALSACVSLACARLIAKKRSTSGKTVKDVTLSVDGAQMSVKGLCDSGNLLVDDFSGLPVMILSKSASEKLSERSIEGYVNVATVGGEKNMPLVKFDSVKVDGKVKNALGAMSDATFGDYDVILQNSMF